MELFCQKNLPGQLNRALPWKVMHQVWWISPQLTKQNNPKLHPDEDWFPSGFNKSTIIFEGSIFRGGPQTTFYKKCFAAWEHFFANVPTLMYRGGRMVGRICWKPVPIKLLKYVIYKTAFLYMKRLIKEIYGLRQALAGTHYSAWQRMYIWNAAIEKCKWFIEFSVLNLAIKCAATSKIIFHLSSRQSSLGHILLWRYFLRKTKSQ